MDNSFFRAFRFAIMLSVLLCWSNIIPPVLAEAGEKLLKDGRIALDQGVYLIAQQQFEEYLKIYADELSPTDYERVYSELLRSLYEQKKFSEIESRLSEIKVKRLQDAGLVTFWATLVCYERGEYSKALDQVSQFEKRYPDSSYVSRMERLKAWCYYKNGDIEKALETFEDYDVRFAASADSAENLLEWSKALLAAGNDKKAAETLNKLVRLPGESRHHYEGRLILGELYLNSRNYKQSISVFSDLANNEKAIADIRAQAYYALASSFSSLTNMADAVSSANMGISVAKTDWIKKLGQLRLGQVYLKGGEIEKGISLLKSFIAEYPNDSTAADVQLELAGAVLEAGKYELAVNEYQYYIETFTNTTGLANAYYGRGWGLYNLGRYSESAVEYIKAHDMFTDAEMKVRALFKVGDAYFQNSQYKIAVETYRRLIDEYPESSVHAAAAFQVGESYARSKHYDEADKVFSDLINSHSKKPIAEEALLRLAEMKVEQGLLRDAVTMYTNLINLNENGRFAPEALVGLSKIYFQQWRFNKALSGFEKVVKDFPESALVEEAYYKRGMCYYWLGQDDKTLEVYTSFVGKYPNSNLTPSVFFWMGRYYFNQAKYRDAEKVFSDFVAMYKDHLLVDDALLWKGYSLIRLREFVAAIETFALMAKDYPASPKMPDARFAQGEALCEIANYDAAILIFAEIINKYPDSDLVVPAWLKKGDSQFILGGDDPLRYEESIGSYRVVINSSGARNDYIYEAKYKSARSLEKMGRTTEAFVYYYKEILLKMKDEKEKGLLHNESSRHWMTKAALSASAIAEQKEDYKSAVSILELMLQIGGETVAEAKSRIEKIKSEHWWLFY